MRIDAIIKNLIQDNDINRLDKVIEEGEYSKLTFSEYENLVNSLFPSNKTAWIKAIISYYGKIVKSNPMQFYHLRIQNKVTASCRELIENYHYIYMYHKFLDCSELLDEWSPTEAYFPFLVYVERSKPDVPVNYIPWLKRFSQLPTALKFLSENKIYLDFTNIKDLKDLYKTIPEKHIPTFLSVLKPKQEYLDALRVTDHFPELLVIKKK